MKYKYSGQEIRFTLTQKNSDKNLNDNTKFQLLALNILGKMIKYINLHAKCWKI